MFMRRSMLLCNISDEMWTFTGEVGRMQTHSFKFVAIIDDGVLCQDLTRHCESNRQAHSVSSIEDTFDSDEVRSSAHYSPL